MRALGVKLICTQRLAGRRADVAEQGDLDDITATCRGRGESEERYQN